MGGPSYPKTKSSVLPSASEPFTQGDTGSRKTNGTVNERRFLPLSWQDISEDGRDGGHDCCRVSM